MQSSRKGMVGERFFEGDLFAVQIIEQANQNILSTSLVATTCSAVIEWIVYIKEHPNYFFAARSLVHNLL
jgi:hypothetical protein